MSPTRIEGVQACVFDANGTLCSITPRQRPVAQTSWATIWGRSPRSGGKSLQNTWLRALEGKHADFWPPMAQSPTGSMPPRLLPKNDARLSLAERRPRCSGEPACAQDWTDTLCACPVRARGDTGQRA